jgi:hypothetical protein
MAEETQARVKGVVKNNVQYIPIKPVVQQLGGTVDWDNNAKSAVINVRDKTAQVFAGQQGVRVNGQDTKLSGETFVDGDTLYVPEDLLTALGLTFSHS